MNRTLRIVFILLCAVMLVYSINQMILRPMWGYMTFLFYVSLFFLFSFALAPTMLGTKARKKYFILSTAGACLMSLGYPPLATAPVILIGFVPFLILEDIISRKNTGLHKAEVFKYTFSGFLLWNILTTFWVSNSALMAGFVAISLNTLFMSLTFLAFHVTKVKLGKPAGYLSLVVYWLSFEYLHHHWELSWPWLTFGNSLAGYPSLVQWYEYTGTTGGSLWILLSNMLLFLGFKSWLDNKQYGKGFFLGWILMVAIPIFISLNIFNHYTEKGVPQDVVVVQPNFEPFYEKFTIPEKIQLTRFISLSKSKLDTSVNYLVYPETSFESVNANALNSDRNIMWLERMVDEYPHLDLITGIGSYRVFDSHTVHPVTVREKVLDSGDTIFYDHHNAAISIRSGVDTIPIYFKSRFVPGAEIFPFKQLLFFLRPLVDKLGGSTEGLTAQPERSVFNNGGNLNVAPVICYESIYSEYCTEYIRKGANAIFIVTNDGWWDDTPGYRQHLVYGALRAIETRRSIARSANSGCSAFINQRGEIEQPTQYGVQAVIRQKILFNDEITFYVRYGDLISKAAIGISLTLVIAFLIVFFKKKNQ